MEGRLRQALARQDLATPVFVVDERLLEANLRILARVREETGCRILLALKGFAMFSTFPLIRRYLDGVCASGLHEARLGWEEFGKEIHTFSPAFRESEFSAVLRHSHTVIFNSFSQMDRFAARAVKAGVEIGLRVNPGFSGNPHGMYDPSALRAGLGIPSGHFRDRDLSLVDGLHFHVLCEQGADSLEKVLEHFERRFARHLPGRRWVNFGGGHWITKPGYDVGLLIRLINRFQQRHRVQVLLEPGEAIAIHTGVLLTTVLDVDDKGTRVAVLDTSASAHMPDTLEMPYSPEILGAEIAKTGKKLRGRYLYTLRGVTCLAGDRIGQWSYAFPRPLRVGDRLVLDDMAHYTMVKTTTFNGIPLPAIAKITTRGKFKVVRSFGYQDFKRRLS